MNAYTPGPWNWQFDSGKWEATIWSGDVYKVHVADVGPSEKSASEVEANAHLIAASPDLLEACALLLKYDKGDQKDELIAMLDYGAAIDQARAAYAKATGAA